MGTAEEVVAGKEVGGGEGIEGRNLLVTVGIEPLRALSTAARHRGGGGSERSPTCS